MGKNRGNIRIPVILHTNQQEWCQGQISYRPVLLIESIVNYVLEFGKGYQQFILNKCKSMIIINY